MTRSDVFLRRCSATSFHSRLFQSPKSSISERLGVVSWEPCSLGNQKRERKVSSAKNKDTKARSTKFPRESPLAALSSMRLQLPWPPHWGKHMLNTGHWGMQCANTDAAWWIYASHGRPEDCRDADPPRGKVLTRTPCQSIDIDWTLTIKTNSQMHTVQYMLHVTAG